MAALDFPASPTLNQTYTANGRTWTWDGTSWNSTPISNVIVSVVGTANEITATTVSGTTTLSLPSALTFTGKTITGGTFNSGAFNGTVGATTPSTVAATTINISNTNVGIAKWSGGDGLSFGGTNGTAFIINNSAGSTNALSLTSAGLGIGMTPSNVLDITQNQNASSTIKILNNSAGTGARVDMVVSNGTAQSQLTTFGTGYSGGGIFRTNGTLVYATGAGGLTLSTDTAQPIYFATNQTERARIDSSGNLGLGVTPSAWYSTVRAMQFGTSGSVEGRSNNLSYLAVGTNYYLNSSAANTYIATAASAKYEQDAGVHKWYTAPSGTAGNAISFTQAMTLDASGQLGIGTSSPNAKLTVSSAGGGNTNGLALTNSASGGGSYGLWVTATANGEGANKLIFADYTAGVNRITLDGSGNVGIGTTSPGTTLHVVGGGRFTSDLYCNLRLFINNPAGQDWALRTNTSSSNFEIVDWTSTVARMSITTGGNVGIGTTSPTYKLDVSDTSGSLARFKSTTASDQFFINNAASNPDYSANVVIQSDNAGSAGHDLFRAQVTNYSGTRFVIKSGGNVGIGTSSPAARLDVATGSDTKIYLTGTSSSQISSISSNTGVSTNYNGLLIASNSTSKGTQSNTGLSSWYQEFGSFNISGDAWKILYQSAGGSVVERARIDSSGYMGIGTSSNLQPLGVGNASANTLALLRTGVPAISGNLGPSINFYLAQSATTSQTGDANIGRITASPIDGWGGYLQFFTKPTDGVPGNAVVERARIDSSGNLLVGTTSNTEGSRLFVSYPYASSGGTAVIGTETDNAGNIRAIAFRNPNGLVGTINTNGSNTNYNTSSDYRLKDITGPLTNSGTFIDALKPKIGTWKIDGSKFVGFLAHEFAEVSPSSVSGEKDAVDSDGKPVYQGMQASSAEVIANLVAELKSLRQRVAALENS